MTSPAYILRPIYPPPPDDAGCLGFLGGNPILPPQFDWPRTASGVAMGFLGQVRLSDLPERFRLADKTEAQVDLLPRDGVLYFFAEMAHWRGIFEEQPGSVAVLWAPETDGLCEVAPPDDLVGQWQMHLSGVWDERAFPERVPQAAPKVPFAVVPYGAMSSHNQLRINLEHQSNREERDRVDVREMLGDWQKAELTRLFGPQGPGLFAGFFNGQRVIKLIASWAGAPAGKFDGPEEVWDLPDSGPDAWPWAWLVVDCTAQTIIRSATPRETPGWIPFVEAARAWIARADAGGLHAAVPDRDAAEFRAWVRALAYAPRPKPTTAPVPAGQAKRAAAGGGVPGAIQGLIGRPGAAVERKTEYAPHCTYLQSALSNGIKTAVPYLLSSPARRRLPARLIELLTTFFDTRHLGGSVHQMLGAPLSVQDVHITHANRVLLLQLVADWRLGWAWGDIGTLQFWMAEEDLRARRFDRVEFTLQSH